MTTDRRSVTLWLPPADFGVFLAYVVMLCIFVPFHEPWVDEAQAWLLSRDLSVYSLLFRNLQRKRFELQPAVTGTGLAVVRPGRILFELAGVDEELARAAMERAIQKLPFKARFVVRPGTHGHAEVAV